MEDYDDSMYTDVELCYSADKKKVIRVQKNQIKHICVICEHLKPDFLCKERNEIIDTKKAYVINDCGIFRYDHAVDSEYL